jgi:hypothetical protein
MVHLNAELLAGHVLGQADQLSPEQLQHLSSCPQCRTEVEELRHIVELSSGSAELAPRLVPADAIWRSIEAEIAADHLSGTVHAGGLTVPDEAAPQALEEGSPASQPQPSAPRWRVLVAAAVGLILGVGGTVLVNVVRNDEVEVVSATPLSALPGETGRGNAELVRDHGTTRLRVSVDGSAPPQEFREVWLINTDGKRMYSLGVLPGGGNGSYPVPTLLGSSLDGFTIVDVSIEPYDGNAAHSLHSQVRGTLPL